MAARKKAASKGRKSTRKAKSTTGAKRKTASRSTEEPRLGKAAGPGQFNLPRE